MAPGCALDHAGLSAQLDRHRRAGRGARVRERTRRALVVLLSEDVDKDLVQEAVSVERECCPFFTLVWEPAERLLSVSVPDGAHEPALDAICFALGLATGQTWP